MAKIENDLGRRIERVIQEFLVENRAAAASAVDLGLGATHQESQSRAGSKIRQPLEPRPRATSSERNAGAERFYAAVKDRPGETMVVLAKVLGEPATVLHRHGKRLRDEGLLRTVGKLAQMRYFPVAEGGIARL